MYPQPKQQFGIFEAILSASILAVAVFLSFYFLGDIRQPEMVRLTYIGLQQKGEPDRLATAEEVRICPDSDLPCLPSSLDGAMFAERRSE